MPSPTFQIRVTGPRQPAELLMRHLAEQAMPLFGPHVRCTRQVRAARRAGHVQAYFTVTRKDDPE